MADGVHEVDLDAGDLTLSGLLARAQDPIATIVALPGGGMTARYFHGHLHRSLSMLELAQRLGYTALALDRPGYGLSAGAPDSACTLVSQAEIIWRAVENAEFTDPGRPVLLLGHSFGSMVALQMAGRNPTGLHVLGVDFNGIGSRFADEVIAPTPETDQRALHWGSESNYPDGSFLRSNMPTARMPAVEPLEALRWQDRVHHVASAVRCRIRITLAEQEGNWANEPSEFARLFDNASSVQLDIQPRSGHNISLSWAARAYHLRALAFFDDCVRLHAD